MMGLKPWNRTLQSSIHNSSLIDDTQSVTDCVVTPQGGLDDRDALQDQTVLPLRNLQDEHEFL
jgi:hypothetical protein